MLREELVGDQLDGLEVRLHGVEVQQRHAEFLGAGNGDLAGVGDPVRHQVRDEIGVRLLGCRHRLRHRLLVDETVLDQALWEPLEHHALGAEGGDVFSHGFEGLSVAAECLVCKQAEPAINCQIAADCGG
jgi:hypothetical protein